MRTGASTAWVVLLAIPIVGLLPSCAGSQKPPPSAVESTGEPGQADAAGPAAPANPAAAAGSALAGPRPPRPKASPEVELKARGQFDHAVQLQGAGDLEGAAAAFEAARRSGADLPWAGLNAGLLQERLGRPGRAVAIYEATLDDFPDFAPAAQNLVRLWLREGRSLDQVEKELRGRLGRGDGVALRVGLAEVLLGAGRFDAAEEECKKALKVDEKSIPAMVALSNAYAGRKRYELARMVLENARQIDELDPAVWNRLGFVELALGNRPQAIENFRIAASLRPDYPEAHANYGAILAEADDFAGAAQELELAVKYAPRSAGTWLDLGNAYRGLQAFEKSETAYRKALELDPAMNDARFNLAVLYLDVPRPGLATLPRLEQGVTWFDDFEKNGGKEPRVAAYRKDAAREIDREKKRLAREEKDRLRKEAEARGRAAPQAAVTPATTPAQNVAPEPPRPPPAGQAGSKLQEGGDK